MGAQHVPPSSTKTRLLTGLGLQVGNPDHERLYLAIKLDTERGYSALTSNSQNLKPQHRDHEGRWLYNIVSDDAISRTIRQIEGYAQPTVRDWYEHWGVARTERNFVIDWFLWHAFRNKDPRNKRKTSTTEFHADDDDGEDGNGNGNGNGSAAKRGSGSSGSSSGLRYDPVRNVNVPV